MSAWGGKKIESFTPWKEQKKIKYLVSQKRQKDKQSLLWNQEKVDSDYKKALKNRNSALKKWRVVGKKGKKPKIVNRRKHPVRGGNYPSGVYNAMIHPFLKYNIAGVIWYQGEANSFSTDSISGAPNYDVMLERLIVSWRKNWGIGNFPFYFVQLPEWKAPWREPIEKTQVWPITRDKMRQVVLKVPKTGKAITLGLGEANNVHPKNKKDVGERLAFLALKNDYGKNIVKSGPIAINCKFKNKKVIITFNNGGADLKFSGVKSIGFAVISKNNEIIKVDAKIICNNKIEIISNLEILEVYYAWADNPAGANLQNTANLPASPFRFKK